MVQSQVFILLHVARATLSRGGNAWRVVAPAGARPRVRVCGRTVAAAAAAAAVVGAILLHANLAPAEETPPRLLRDLGAYALFGRSSLDWQGASVMPRRGAVGSLAAVNFSARTMATGDESFVAAPSVTASDGSQLHAVFTSAFQTQGGSEVAHPPLPLTSPPLAESHWPRTPSITCGGADITVDASNSPLTLAPGRYNVVTVSQDKILQLVPGGRYELCSLRVRPGATIEAHTGTFVLLRDHLTTGARARITGTGACGARWFAQAVTPSPAPASAGFEFGQGTGSSNRATIEGQFFTPGRITMAQHNDYVGRFWADRIDGFGAEQVTRTLSDCAAPSCGDGILDAGEACDDGNNLDGDCCSSFCEIGAANAPCDDGRFCTTSDVCDAQARCIGSGTPCGAPDGDINCLEACNEDTDACDAPDPDASPCDDGVFCNGSDLCAAGLCGVHAGSPCSGPDQDANCRESCNEASRTCDAPDPFGVACDDARFCTVGETCDATGTCVGGVSPCPGADNDADCTESCDELADACSAFDAEGIACNDGLFCTATDRCDGRGVCQGWSDPCATFAGDGDSNCAESCNEEADACNAADRDGAPCSDGLACTLEERCLTGVCSSTGRTRCDDFNPCTDEFCSPDGSCLRSHNSSPCDDGNACTFGDRCTLGACAGAGVVDCRDDDLCTSDVCDPADGSCQHPYAPADACHQLGQSVTRFKLGYSAKDGELAETLTTSWRGSGEPDATAREELGNPSGGDAFSVCFYEGSGGVPALAYRLDLEGSTLGGAKWKRSWRASDVVYKLKSPEGTTQGVSQVRLGVDKKGSPAFKLKAGAGSGCSGDCRGKFRPPTAKPDGRLFAMENGLTVQWVAENGACWSSHYAEAAENGDQGFRARARRR